MDKLTTTNAAEFAGFDVFEDGHVAHIALSGDWRHQGIEPICDGFLDIIDQYQVQSYILDMSKITQFDTAGAWMVRKFEQTCGSKNRSCELKEAAPDMLSLLSELPQKLEEAKVTPDVQRTFLHNLFRRVGIGCEDIWQDVKMGLNILGAMFYGSQSKSGRSGAVSSAAIINQMDQIGVRAVPIVVLMSLAIGAIISQQAAFQLRLFGAEVFAADLVSVLQLREVGVLITSIMIAGRSGSAITAEIGSMKMREEVDALTVMGLNPISVLIFPRMIALVLTLPLLTIIANYAALFASVLVLYFYSEVPPNIFLNRMKDFIDYTTITSGMIKTPFMAIIIGVVSAVEGLKVGGSAESLGRRVTAAVVKSIFLVILVDGIFAIFFAAIDF